MPAQWSRALRQGSLTSKLGWVPPKCGVATGFGYRLDSLGPVHMVAQGATALQGSECQRFGLSISEVTCMSGRCWLYAILAGNLSMIGTGSAGRS